MTFTVTFVEGVTPDKWRRRWPDWVRDTSLQLVPVAQDDQLDAVRTGAAAMGFVRDLPERERLALHHIPLYQEVPVVVVPREHPAAAYDEIEVADLIDETVLDDDALSPRLKVETVAAGTGIAFLPMSVARLHHRRDVAAVPLLSAVPTEIGLTWRRDLDDPLVETFVGIVRGRTVNSTRGTPAAVRAKDSSRSTSAPARRGRRRR